MRRFGTYSSALGSVNNFQRQNDKTQADAFLHELRVKVRVVVS